MKKIGVIIIFGGISFVFVFMGYNTFGPTTSGYAAVVNNSIITLYEHQNMSNQMINFYSKMFGDSFDMSETQIQQIREAALDQLIGEEVLSSKASEIGLLVAPEMVRDKILAIDAFKTDGKFDRTLYETFLSNQKLTSAKFEEQIKKSIRVSMINDTISKNTRLTKRELESLWTLENTKFNLEFIKVEDSFNLGIQKREIEQFLSDNETDISDYYQNNQHEFSNEEQIRASHILISTQKEDISTKEALKLANETLNRTNTEDFAEIAKAISDDPGSGEQGGDLGYFSRGKMLKEFEDTAFNMNIGEIKGPIKTQFGYHIIKLTDKKDPSVLPLSEVSFDIAQKLVTQEKKDAFVDKIEKYLEEGQKPKIDNIIKQYNLSWQETGEFSLNDEEIPNIGTKPMILNRAKMLSLENPLHNKIIKDGSDFYIIYLKQKVLADTNKITDEFITTSNERYKKEVLDRFKQDAIQNARITKTIQM